ncbi:hypothetical protein [Catellatospora sp. NPDC049609]|uniref:golvesin C-terminal-like domain-containing protein n=1 Tax=Catellatospora sp. NPDC049609 TaxID=3155505 RepID=UPI00342F0142
MFKLLSDDGSVRVTQPNGPDAFVRMNVGQHFRFPNELNPVTDLAAARAYRAALDVKEVMPGDEGPVTLRMNGAKTHFDSVTGLVHLHNQQNSVLSPITESAIAQAFLSDAYPDGSYPGQGCPQGAWLGYRPGFSEVLSDACAFAYGTAAFIGMQADLRNRGTDQSPTFRLPVTTPFSVETCLYLPPDDFLGCAEGPGELLRITAVLWDLADNANEIPDGTGAGQSFTDFTGHGFAAVTAHLLADVPVDVDELWDGWRASHTAQERLIFFMNTLEYTDLQDDNLATNVAGTWIDTECGTCRDGDYRFTDPAGGSAEISWDLGRHLTEAGDHEVWVRLPAGQAGDETNALYTVDIAGGTRQVGFNQASTTDGWVRLPATFDIDPAGDNILRLRNTDGSTTTLKADAIILAPNEDPAGVVGPPRVTVSGKVMADRRMSLPGQASPQRPLPGAKWELWYEGKAGSDSDAVQWRQVKAEGSDAPLTGYLDDQGRFDIDFVYPQRHQLANGTQWHGCEATDTSFMSSHACGDDKLVLKVFPVNADVSAAVREPGSFEPGDYEPMLTINLGHFFQREGGLDYQATSMAAHAYAGIYNVRDFAGAEMLGDAHIYLHNRAGSTSSYDPRTGTIHLLTAHSPSSVVEHEVGHQLLHSMYGLTFVLWVKENCQPHYIDRPSSQDCAWSEGFADWIAVAAENEPGSTSWTNLTWSGGDCPCLTDIEARATEGWPYLPGSEVEGNIAAALFDLIDNNPPSGGEPNTGDLEGMYSFFDTSMYPVQQLLQVIGDTEPKNFTEFWPAWVDFNAGEQRDAETFWLNTLHYTKIADAFQANGKGTWNTRICGTSPRYCYLDDVAISKDSNAKMSWDLQLDPEVNPRSGLWDVWVYIPEGDLLDPQARYTIKTKSGPKTYAINQEANRGQWVLINPASGLALDTQKAVTVELSRNRNPGSIGTSIVADAVLIAPRLPG